MTLTLDLETSLAFLDGSGPAWNIELDAVETLRLRGITEPAVVVLIEHNSIVEVSHWFDQ